MNYLYDRFSSEKTDLQTKKLGERLLDSDFIEDRRDALFEIKNNMLNKEVHYQF